MPPRDPSHLLSLAGAGSKKLDGKVAFMEEHAKAHPAEFCTFIEAALRGDGPVHSRCSSYTLGACLSTLWYRRNDVGPGQALQRALASDDRSRLGPRLLSLMLSALKFDAAAPRTPTPWAPPGQAARLDMIVALVGHSAWDEACSTEGRAAGSARDAPNARAKDAPAHAGRNQGLNTSSTSWAALMARGLAAAGRAASASTGFHGAWTANTWGVKAGEVLWTTAPAVCDAVVLHLRACGLPGASQAAEQLQQQRTRIAALAEAAAAEVTAPTEGAPAA
mgnify:CR=1 FL=1